MNLLICVYANAPRCVVLRVYSVVVVFDFVYAIFLLFHVYNLCPCVDNVVELWCNALHTYMSYGNDWNACEREMQRVRVG